MRSRSSTALLTAVTFSVVLAACSDPQAPAPAVTDTEATVDLAISAGQMIAMDLGLLLGSEFDATGLPAGAVLANVRPGGDGRCARGDDGRHRCPGVTAEGMTHTRSFAFYDASHTLQESFDRLTTASIEFQMTMQGTVTREDFTATINRQRNATLSGLAGEETERTWNAIGSGSHNSVHTGPRGTRTHVMSVNDTTTNVVFALPRAENPWPKSGTIVNSMDATITVTGERAGTRTIKRRALVTFNGTAIVPLVVGERACTLNLETRRVVCADAT